MADPRLRRAENVPGDLYVDESCIDCDTCRWMAPDVFSSAGGKSAVHAQPATAASRLRALQALVSCPTASIGASDPVDWQQVTASLPAHVAGVVHHCGYHSVSSFGAASYLILRPGGNILIDSPRFTAPLVRRLEAMGGVSRILLTHRDDVADQARFAAHFGATSWIHARDAGAAPGAQTWSGNEPVEVVAGLTMLPVPGHTAGHVAYLLERTAGEGPFLFTGDHLAFDAEGRHLEAWPEVCWHDWGQQVASMRRLLSQSFEWVLPGHGRPGRMAAAGMRKELERLVAWMEGQQA